MSMPSRPTRRPTGPTRRDPSQLPISSCPHLPSAGVGGVAWRYSRFAQCHRPLCKKKVTNIWSIKCLMLQIRISLLSLFNHFNIMQLWLLCSTATQTVVEPIPNAPHPPLWRSLSCPYCLPAGEHLLLPFPTLESEEEIINGHCIIHWQVRNSLGDEDTDNNDEDLYDFHHYCPPPPPHPQQ